MLRAVMSVLAVLTLACGCQSSPEWIHPYGAGHPLAGSIYDVARQSPVDEAALLAELATADFVLLGETHDNLDHHRLEARVVEALGSGERPLTAAAFEMIETDQQAVVVEQLQAGDDALARLGAALRWEKRGWPAFEAYRLILVNAHDAGAEIVAAGLPSATVAEVMAEGGRALPQGFAERTGLTRPLPPLLAADLGHEIATAHCGQLEAGLLTRIADAQRAKDASLADRLVTVTGRGRGVLVAGAAHVRKDWGVPWYIENLRPDARTVSIAFVEVDRAREMPTASLAYDYVWFTPAAHPPGSRGCEPAEDEADQIEARGAPAIRPGVPS
jgi:uncharacterized iron-regulated protein